MKKYQPVGYNFGLGTKGHTAFALKDAEWRDITEPSEDGISWRIRQPGQSFRVSVTGRTLKGEVYQAEELKLAMLMAIRDEVAFLLARGGKLASEDHPVTVSEGHLEEGRRIANAPTAPSIQ